jgi:hypothetical protein
MVQVELKRLRYHRRMFLNRKGMKPPRHYGRVVKATDSNFPEYLFPYGSAGSNPAGVDFLSFSHAESLLFFLEIVPQLTTVGNSIASSAAVTLPLIQLFPQGTHEAEEDRG